LKFPLQYNSLKQYNIELTPLLKYMLY